MDIKQSLSIVSEAVKWMKENNVKSISVSESGFSVEVFQSRLAPSEPVDAVAPAASVFSDADGAGVCSCGHSWLEHTEFGCLHGCSHEVCTTTGAKDEDIK